MNDDDLSQPKPSRKVNFGFIDVRQYNRSLSDNPSVTTGVPVGIDWSWHQGIKTSIAEYESIRYPDRRDHRIFTFEGRLDPKERLDIAIESGNSLDEIERIVAEVQKLQDERYASLTSIGWDPINNAKEVFVSLGEASMNALKRITLAKTFGRRWKKKAEERAQARRSMEQNADSDAVADAKDAATLPPTPIEPPPDLALSPRSILRKRELKEGGVVVSSDISPPSSPKVSNDDVQPKSQQATEIPSQAVVAEVDQTAVNGTAVTTSPTNATSPQNDDDEDDPHVPPPVPCLPTCVIM